MPHESWTLEENLQEEVMSDAHKYPLIHQLNSAQIQPFHHHPSHDMCADPDNILPSEFNDDEPHDVLTANPS